MSRRRDFEDDGRTIADMSGLSGRNSDRSGPGRTAPERTAPKGPTARPGRETGHAPAGWQDTSWENTPREDTPWEYSPISWKERFHYMGAALGAALLIALAFLGGLALVIWLVTLYGK